MLLSVDLWAVYMYGVPFTTLHSLVEIVPLVYTPALIPTHQPPPLHPSCSLSVTVGVAVLVVSIVLLLIAVSSVCLRVLVTRDANKLLTKLLTPYQLLPYSLRLSINGLISNQPSIAHFYTDKVSVYLFHTDEVC